MALISNSYGKDSLEKACLTCQFLKLKHHEQILDTVRQALTKGYFPLGLEICAINMFQAQWTGLENLTIVVVGKQ